MRSSRVRCRGHRSRPTNLAGDAGCGLLACAEPGRDALCAEARLRCGVPGADICSAGVAQRRRNCGVAAHEPATESTWFQGGGKRRSGEKKRTDIGARHAARRMRRGSVLVGVLLPLMLAAPARAFKFVLPLRSALGAALLLPV